MTGRIALEIAVQDAAGVRRALAAGADRVELCQALGTGGLTPSAGTIDAAVAAAGDPRRVAVLVRPRGGGFMYDAEEVAVVAADVADAVRRGAGAVVVGALRPDGTIDRAALDRWRAAAGEAELVFHRAIDTLAEPAAAIEALVDAGVARILTSGGAVRSIHGADVLAALVREARGRLEIMAGGGVRTGDIARLARCGVDAVHLSARARSQAAGPSGPGGGDAGHDVTDERIVADAVAAIRSLC